jgi:site-specific recombinase XerD
VDQITPHTFRHSFTIHLLETNHNIKTLQELFPPLFCHALSHATMVR